MLKMILLDGSEIPRPTTSGMYNFVLIQIVGIHYQPQLVNAGFLAPCISSMPVLLWVPGAPANLFS